MASNPSILSTTLQSITETKIHELEKRKSAFEKAKCRILNDVGEVTDGVHARVETLLNGIEGLDGSHSQDLRDELQKIRRWLTQAEYDPSFPASTLADCEKRLCGYLDHRSQKFGLASLYSKLLTEWIESPDMPETPSDRAEEESGSEEAFEVLEDTQKARLHQLRDKFARVVFEPLQTDEVAIDLFLSALFESDQGQSALQGLRDGFSKYGQSIWEQDNFFSDYTLLWAIKGLQNNDLLNDEKKATLSEFLKDEAVLAEVRDVLNLRYRHLAEWQWPAGEEGIPVVPRRSLNGKWRVMMDEDVLEAIFSHSIGSHWAARVRELLFDTRHFPKLWHSQSSLSEEEKRKWQYYFDNKTYKAMTDKNNVIERRQELYNDRFFLSPLPFDLRDAAGDCYSDNDTEERSQSGRMIKQLLLRTLATEVIVRRSLDGEVAVVQSDFQWFATGISHATVLRCDEVRGIWRGMDWLLSQVLGATTQHTGR